MKILLLFILLTANCFAESFFKELEPKGFGESAAEEAIQQPAKDEAISYNLMLVLRKRENARYIEYTVAEGGLNGIQERGRGIDPEFDVEKYITSVSGMKLIGTLRLDRQNPGQSSFKRPPFFAEAGRPDLNQRTLSLRKFCPANCEVRNSSQKIDPFRRYSESDGAVDWYPHQLP